MSGLKAAIRRRKQRAKGNRHVAEKGRSVYKAHSAGYYAAKLRRQVQKERDIAFRKGLKNKK